MAVLIVATLDTKGVEAAFARDLIRDAGFETVLIDAGSLGPPAVAPDIDREEVFRLAGSSLSEIQAAGDRGRAVETAARGAAEVATRLAEQGRVQGILGLGGSAGSTIGSAAMRVLPFGIPKVLVSTLASGQTRPYVGGADIVMVNAVADICGLNRISRTILGNAANALAGMLRAPGVTSAEAPDRPIIAATMFGVTTPCVEHARAILEAEGYEVIVFHATGVGGQAMEGLIRDGKIAGVLDITTTELADELVGGTLSAGPDRLEAAGRLGIPQVVSLGALDMVNFGPASTVPEAFRGRRLHVHNPTVTLMRTTPEENAALGTKIADILNRSRGLARVLIPLGGVSAIDAPGKPFHDPDADRSLFRALEAGLRQTDRIRLISREEHVNDSTFAEFAARTLLELLPSRSDPAPKERQTT